MRVLALVNLTLELERLADGLIAGRGGKLLQKRNYDSQGHPHTLVYERGDPHLLMHLTGIIQSLLKSLGLDKEPKPDRKADDAKNPVSPSIWLEGIEKVGRVQAQWLRIFKVSDFDTRFD